MTSHRILQLNALTTAGCGLGMVATRGDLHALFGLEAPILLECPEWRGYQLFEAPAARGCQFYVLHHLADRSALDSEWRRRSRSTPWFHRLSKNKWFDGPFERILCRRVAARRDSKSKK